MRKPLFTITMILQSELIRLRKAVNSCDMLNEHVSAAPIGWHIDHALKVIQAVCEQLHESNPANFKWNFNLKRNYAFIRGSFPRGKGHAPRIVRPTNTLTHRELIRELDQAEQLLASILSLPKNCFFRHPYFGDLNVKRAIYFMKIHTVHHLKIIDEIEYSCLYSVDSVQSEVQV